MAVLNFFKIWAVDLTKHEILIGTKYFVSCRSFFKIFSPIHPSIHPLIHSMHCASDWKYKCEKKVWSCLGAYRAFGGGWGGWRSEQTIMLQWDWWSSGIFEEETLKLTWGPEERGEDQLSRGHCKCKDTDTQNIVASSRNHSGLILVECMLAGDWDSKAGRQGPDPWGSCTGLRPLSCRWWTT